MSIYEPGRPDPIPVEDIGGMVRYRWPDTGEEFWATVSYILPRLPERDDVDLILVIDKCALIVEQLATARKLFNGLRQHTASEILQAAREVGEVVIGRFPYWDVTHLMKEARRHGLLMRIRKAESGG